MSDAIDPADMPGAIDLSPEHAQNSVPTTSNATESYVQGGGTPSMDPADMPGAIDLPDSGSIGGGRAPADAHQGATGVPADIDPADMPGAIDLPENAAHPKGGGGFGIGLGLANTDELKAAGEGLVEGLIGDTATAALETKLGISTPEAIRQREEDFPVAKEGAKAASMIGSTLLGKGALGILGAGTEAIAHAIPFLAAKTLSARVGAGALRGALEMGLLRIDSETAKFIKEDPKASMEAAIPHVLFDAGLGLGGGALFGGIGHLLAAKPAQKAAQEMENFKGQLKQRSEGGDPVDNVYNELVARHDEVKAIHDGAWGLNGTKMEAIAKTVPKEMTPAISSQMEELVGSSEKLLNKMRNDEILYPKRLTQQFENQVTGLKSALGVLEKEAPSMADTFAAQTSRLAGEEAATRGAEALSSQVTPEEAFKSIDLFKRKFQEMAQDLKRTKSTADDYPFLKAIAGLAPQFKSALEDPKVWGDAARIQNSVNGAFSKFKPFFDKFEQVFGEKHLDSLTGKESRVVSKKNIETFLKQAGTAKDVEKRNILKGFLDHSEQYAESLKDAFSAIGEESPFTASPMNNARLAVQDLTPGMKLANVFYDEGLKAKAKGIAGGLGTAIGSGIGSIFGPAGAAAGAAGGAYVGIKSLGPMIEKVLPLAGKAFFEKAANFKALQAVNNMVSQVAKSEQLLSKSTRNLFRAGAEAIPLPAEKALKKLDQRLVAENNDQDKTLDRVSSNPMGDYMPDHASALAQSYFNALGYANQLRPKTDPRFPLDPKRMPSNVEQSKYNRALSIMAQPLQVIDRIKNGSITLDDVSHLNALYPGYYAKMRGQVFDQMASHIAKGGAIPYKTRIGLSLFMQKPMDSSFSPEIIMAAQPKPQQAPQQGAQGRKPRQMAAGKLKGFGEDAMTPLQARQKREMKG